MNCQNQEANQTKYTADDPVQLGLYQLVSSSKTKNSSNKIDFNFRIRVIENHINKVTIICTVNLDVLGTIRELETIIDSLQILPAIILNGNDLKLIFLKIEPKIWTFPFYYKFQVIGKKTSADRLL